jgi:serine O-acetyltransferase
VQKDRSSSRLLGPWIDVIEQISLDSTEVPDAFLERDPAARTRAEVALLYPGFRAILLHRIAHALWHTEKPFLARACSEFSRFVTGIEIHPGATLGRRVVIDHGLGVVIGETAVVEDDVLLYQGVTLGGSQNTKIKRHPTLRRSVVVGAGATVLGNITIGEGAHIGAGAVVLGDVPPGESVGGVPAKPLRSNNVAALKRKGEHNAR